MILKQLLKPDLMELIDEGDWEPIRTCLEDWEAPEIAELIADAEPCRRVLIFRLLHRDVADEVFAYLDFDTQNQLVQEMADEETRRILSNLSADDRTTFFEELPDEVAHRLMGVLPPDVRRETLELLGYPEGSVGRLMTTEYVTVRPDWTVAQCLEHFRKAGEDSETMSIIFVVDDQGKLLDGIRLRLFLLSPPETKVADLMEGTDIYLTSLMDQEKAVEAFKKYDRYCIPVVGSDGKLLGIVTADDVLDVAEEEATEDIHKGAAVNSLNESYRSISVGRLIARRIPWLVGLVFVGLVSSGVIAAFEETLSKMLALAFFCAHVDGQRRQHGFTGLHPDGACFVHS